MTDTFMKLDDKHAHLLEGVHKDHLFCYAETMIADGVWRLSIVRDQEVGHYPISEDWFMGTEQQARNEAEHRMRLKLPSNVAASIVGQSMKGAK